MKVLMISGDKRLLEEGSEAQARLTLQRSQVEQLDAFVWPQIHSRAEITRAARETKYDVITAQDPFWRGLLAWRLARKTGAKLNLQLHADLSGQSLLKRLLAAFLLRRADTIRVVSEHSREQLMAHSLRARITLLPVYIDLARFSLLQHVAHDGPREILWVGRFEEEKDPLAALDVLGKVNAAGVPAKLVMLGAGSLDGRLRTEAAARQLPVEFPGWQDPAAYLARADLVLCTSRHESYGASIIEALAAGVAVVAPDVGIAQEAGAIIARRDALAEMALETLRAGEQGELKIALPSAEEWARQWRATLV